MITIGKFFLGVIVFVAATEATAKVYDTIANTISPKK